MKRFFTLLVFLMVSITLTAFLFPGSCIAQDVGHDLRAAAQNPLANMYSLPLQNNTDFGIGPHDRTKNTLNIQPVIPFSLGKGALINRVILPVVYQPDTTEESGGTWGLGDTTWTAWYAPPAKGFTWGVGPVFLLPTSSQDETGLGEWGAGASFVVLTQPSFGTVGFLVSNVWSAYDDNDNRLNLLTFQPFFNYNLPNSWYLTIAPILTANWEADKGDQWTVPLGGGVGKIFSIGKQAINSQVSTYYNFERPDGGADWQLRVQVQFMWPK